MTDRDAAGPPKMDHSHRFDGAGRPRRPLGDLMTARHMVFRGFGRDDVEHLLGYLPAGWDQPEMPEPDAHSSPT